MVTHKGMQGFFMEKLSALIVEDNQNLATAFAEAVMEASYRVDIVHDGLVALEKLRKAVPTLVVLDLHIQNVEGVEILDYIRREKRLQDVRVVVVTADKRIANELHGIANLVMIKPVGYKQLKNLADQLRPK